MDEDFFRDYPAPADPDPAPPSAAPPAAAFVLPDPDSPHQANGHSSPPPAEPAAPPPDDAQPECPAVTEWRAAFARGLEEKVRSERSVKADRTDRARQTLATMRARWEASAADARDRNLKAEKDFVMQRDGVISRMSKPGDTPAWDIVPELVDMTGKYKEGARDTSRMRQVLMRMKTN